MDIYLLYNVMFGGLIFVAKNISRYIGKIVSSLVRMSANKEKQKLSSDKNSADNCASFLGRDPFATCNLSDNIV
jgi:hypothetical protein